MAISSHSYHFNCTLYLCNVSLHLMVELAPPTPHTLCCILIAGDETTVHRSFLTEAHVIARKSLSGLSFFFLDFFKCFCNKRVKHQAIKRSYE